MTTGSLDHDGLLTLARKAHAAAGDADTTRLAEELGTFVHALAHHLDHELPTLRRLPPAEARLVRRDQARVSAAALALLHDAAGDCAAARFRRPEALAVDVDGTCYVADTGNNAIRRISPNGDVTTLAGSPPGGDGDGAGAEVGLRWPTGLALGGDGVSTESYGWPTTATARSAGSTALARAPRPCASPGATGPLPLPEHPTER